MPPQITSKQIIKLLSGLIRIASHTITANAGSQDITAKVSTALTTAGNNGVAVPNQVSSNISTMGLITATPYNRVPIWQAGTKRKWKTTNNEEIFARLTTSSSNYFLTFYYENSGGSEIVFTPTVADTIDFYIPYRFDLNRFPTDLLLEAERYTFQDVPSTAGGGAAGAASFVELLTITTLNEIPVLTKTPSDPNTVFLIVNGQIHHRFGASPSFTVSGKTCVWSATNAGFDIDPAENDQVVAMYNTTE